MATLTTNYHLAKPDITDAVSIAVINDNMDILDARIKTNANDISSVANDISSVASDLSEHESNDTKHITADERTEWNSKTDDTTVNEHKSDATVHITADERSAWNSKTDDTNLNTHMSDNIVHITADDRIAWNGKTDDTTVNAHKSDTTVHITANERTKWNSMVPLSGGTITGKVNLTSTAEFKFLYHAERRFTGLSPSPTYTNWDADKKDGNWHRIWRISFPSNSNFWGRLTIGMVGNYSSFNASGYMEKEINLAFNTSSCFNNVGRYIALGGNAEKDFRISEAIWNSNTSKWEILIYSNVPNGNNAPSSVVLSCETNNPSYISAFENITVLSNCEISDIVTYNNVCGRFDGSTLVKSFKDLPVYESPYGYPIITTNELNPIVDGLVPKTGTTMTGALVAQTNTDYTTAQMRNVIISTSNPSGGSSGDIWIKYA